MSIQPENAEATQTRPEAERLVLCRSCQHAITSPKQAVEVHGAHEHTFRNPAGYSYHVVCYAEAPGCLVVGDSTSEATWFAGYAWRFAICGGCQQHLGWHYRSAAHSFHGLIATRLLR